MTERVALIPEASRNSWRYHSVVAGDTLASVAQEYRVSAAELASANQLTASQSLSGIDALAVPVPLAAEPLAHARLYTVRRGDTLVTIADRFGVSLSQLRRWNSDPLRHARGPRPPPARGRTRACAHILDPPPQELHHADRNPHSKIQQHVRKRVGQGARRAHASARQFPAEISSSPGLFAPHSRHQ